MLYREVHAGEKCSQLFFDFTRESAHLLRDMSVVCARLQQKSLSPLFKPSFLKKNDILFIYLKKIHNCTLQR